MTSTDGPGRRDSSEYDPPELDIEGAKRRAAFVQTGTLDIASLTKPENIQMEKPYSSQVAFHKLTVKNASKFRAREKWAPRVLALIALAFAVASLVTGLKNETDACIGLGVGAGVLAITAAALKNKKIARKILS